MERIRVQPGAILILAMRHGVAVMLSLAMAKEMNQLLFHLGLTLQTSLLQLTSVNHLTLPMLQLSQRLS